jgi:N-acetylglucosaminyldiphosphoundecaprenol N-acetyl-beta-D-mannosaminyltransferase
MSDSFHLGALALTRVASREAAEQILAAARAGRSCVVVTSNIHHLRLAEVDAAFRNVVSRAEINVADGWPLVAASRLLSETPLQERVAGVDLVASLLQSGLPLRLAILGGPPGAAASLAHAAAEMHDIVIVDELPRGTWERPEDIEALCARLAAARPNLTLVGLGAPRQELLADRLRGSVTGPIICCGAAIEILAGCRRRAPRVVQVVGLEWAFRLLLEPRRLGPRYLHASISFLLVLMRAFAARRGGTSHEG